MLAGGFANNNTAVGLANGGSSGVDALVSGADFATYHRLRDLESEEYEIGTRGITLNALYSRKTGNQDGHAWMLTTDLERI